MAINIQDDLRIDVVVNEVQSKTIDNVYSVGAPNTYVPGKDFAANDDVSAGVIVTYVLGISLSSKSNQQYAIDKFFLQSQDDPKTNGTGAIPFYLLNTNPDPLDVVDDMLYTPLVGYEATMTSVVLGPDAGITSSSTISMSLQVHYPTGVYWKTKIAPRIFACATKEGITQKSALLQPEEIRMSSNAPIQNNLYYEPGEWSGIRLTTVDGQKGFNVSFYMKSQRNDPANIATLLDQPNCDIMEYKAVLSFSIDAQNISITVSQISVSLQSGLPQVSIQNISVNGSEVTVQLKRNDTMKLPIIIRAVVFLPYDPGVKPSVTMIMNASWGTPQGVDWQNWVNQALFPTTTIGGFIGTLIIPLVFVNPPRLSNSVSAYIQPPNQSIGSYIAYSNLNFVNPIGSKLLLLYDSKMTWINDATPSLIVRYTKLGEVVASEFIAPSDAFVQQYAYVPLPSGYNATAIGKSVFDGSVTLGTYAQIEALGNKPNVLMTTIIKDVYVGLPIDFTKNVSIYYQDSKTANMSNTDFNTLYQSNPGASYTSYIYTVMQMGTYLPSIVEAQALYGSLLGIGDEFRLINGKVYLFLATSKIGDSAVINRFNTISTVRQNIPAPTFRAQFLTSISDNIKDTLTSIFDYTRTYPLRFSFPYYLESFSTEGKMLKDSVISFVVPLAIQPFLYIVSEPGIYRFDNALGVGALIAPITQYTLLPGKIEVTLPQDVLFESTMEEIIYVEVPVRFIPPFQDVVFSHAETSFDPTRFLLTYPNQLVTGFSSATPFYIVTKKNEDSTLQGSGIDFSGLSVNRNFYPSGSDVVYTAMIKNKSNTSDDFYMGMSVPTNLYNPLETSNNTQEALIKKFTLFDNATILYYQTKTNVTAQDIQVMKEINQPGVNLKTYYNSVVTNSWTQYQVGDVLPNDVIMCIGYTPSVALGESVRIDYQVHVEMDPNTTEVYTNDAAFNYFSNASNLETQSNKVSIQNFDPDEKITITKSPLTQNVIAEVEQELQFVIEFIVPNAAISYSSLVFSDALPLSLLLLNTSTMQIGNDTPTPLDASMSAQKVVAKSFTNIASMAGKNVIITLRVKVDDISKIPPTGKDMNTAALIVNNNPLFTYLSNEVEIVYQFADVFHLQKNPLSQNLPKVIGTPVSFSITMDIPSDTSEITSLILSDVLHPSLLYQPNDSFLQIGATPMGLLEATVVGNVVTCDLSGFIAQAAGKVIKITLGTILQNMDVLPVDNTIENEAKIIINAIPAYTFTSNTVEVIFGNTVRAIPVSKKPTSQQAEPILNAPIQFGIEFTLPLDTTGYNSVMFSDTLASCLSYETTSTVQFGNNAPVPLDAIVVANTISKKFESLNNYAGQKVIITLHTKLTQPLLIPPTQMIYNVAQLVVNEDVLLTSISNQVVVRFKKVGPYDPAITDVIESVALQQTALAHILNAEGEKIQWILAHEVTSEDFLAVNDSVTSTVNSITRLETILVNKLTMVQCVCEEGETK